jgi:hypothetical protein
MDLGDAKVGRQASQSWQSHHAEAEGARSSHVAQGHTSSSTRLRVEEDNNATVAKRALGFSPVMRPG